MPNTPFYRDAENCGQFYDSIYVPNYTPYNYSLTAETEDGFRYFMAVYGHEDGTAYLNYDILDQFDNALIVNTIIKPNGRIEAYNNFGLDDVDFGNKTYQLVLVKGKIEDGYIRQVSPLEVIGCISFIPEVQCKSKIKITYELYCGYEYKFDYYLKGQLNRQPAISEENISFLGTNGQPNMLFGITHLPMMLTTGVMGWREQQFLEQILNKNNFMINGNSVNKADGAIFTVRNSATKGLIGSILLIASTIVFNACCKEYEALPQNYRVDNVVLESTTYSVEFATTYVSANDNPWVITEGDGIYLNPKASGYHLSAVEIDAISTGTAIKTVTGLALANAFFNKYLSDTDPNKPMMSQDGNKLSMAFVSNDFNAGLIVYNGDLISPSWDNFANVQSPLGVSTQDFDDAKFYTAKILINGRFFVKINDIWVEKTNEIFNGSWKILNTIDNITEWKTTQSDGTTVVQSGQVTAF